MKVHKTTFVLFSRDSDAVTATYIIPLKRFLEYNILASKLQEKIGFLFWTRASFPVPCRKRIIESVFLSVLDYADVIYRHAASSVLKPLDSVYHSAFRFITGDVYGTHHCTMCEKAGLSFLLERHDFYLWFQITILYYISFYQTSWYLPNFTLQAKIECR